MTSVRRARALTIAATAVTTLVAGALLPGTSASAAEPTVHVVQLDDAPLASYRGGIPGLPATNPDVLGKTRLDVGSAASRAYLRHLAAVHSTVETSIETALGHAVDRVHDYRYAFNGFAVELSDAEAARVRQLPQIAMVQPAFERELLTDAGPAWIGAESVWSGASTGTAAGTRGEGVVVGVIDTGINHDHPSFADVGGDGYNHKNPRGRFYGACDPVTGAPFCNDKLIGVWDFTGTTPLDDNQHGSHTASTAAGNRVEAAVHAPTIDVKRSISGVAPHANLITYKACIAVGCLSPSLVAAIDQATADMVDVINYSIGGGSSNPWSDADAQAFLGARDAGVFVAASAGNSGPGAETVGSPSDAPWITSVAASTHDRTFVNSVTNMSGGATTPPGTLSGKSFTSGYGPATIVHAADYGDALCRTPFAPGTFNGEIVVCRRGINPRVEKGSNVKAGGAGGMVLVNTAAEGESTVADPHTLPAVHLGFDAGRQLEAWVRDGGSGHTATIAGTTADQRPENGDVMAGFSSRGPNPSVPGVLKPDISAPGVDVLAAVHTTDPTAPPEYGLLSGTSMSSPHLAGAAALVRALRPGWTPAEVQSALMTTALDSTMRKEDGTTAADPFDMGAGRVDLTKAARAGLLFDEDAADYTAANPAAGGDPTRLNLPSLASGDCAGTCTWVRAVRNPLSTSATWSVSTAAPQGMTLSVKPKRLSLAPGATGTLTVTADVTNLPAGSWRFAEVTLQEKKAQAPAVHLPVAVLPGGAPTPVEITSASTTGSHVETLTAPVRITDLTANVLGLQQGSATTHRLAQDPTPLEPYDGLGGTFHVNTDVPAGARLLAAEIASTTSSDLDLFVGLDTDGDGAPDEGEEVCRSASEVALEACKITDPAAGKYWVMVQNWLTGQVVDDVELVVATVPGTDNGNLTVTGPSGVVREGERYDVTLAWNEPAMKPGTTWFALVELAADGSSPAGSAGSMLVTIDRP
ncbi:MAG: S8 family serine peptidase [Actinomycetota bacterium]|nr:S8 family serine peptidase [Actinomycetota bacterium]